MSELVLASRKARTSLFCALNLTTLFSLDPVLASSSSLPVELPEEKATNKPFDLPPAEAETKNDSSPPPEDTLSSTEDIST